MNRKLASIILLIALVAIALVAAMPATADEPVNIDPIVGGPYAVSANDNIHLYYWFWAMAPGHVNAYIKRNETTYTLRDANDQIVWSLTAEEAEQYWSEIFKADFSDFFDYPMPYVYASAWEYPLGQLATGTYSLTSEILFTRTVTDGAHVIRDPETGERIFPTPSIFPKGTTGFFKCRSSSSNHRHGRLGLEFEATRLGWYPQIPGFFVVF